MNRLNTNVARRIGAVTASLTVAVLIAACSENFSTNPSQLRETLSLTHWADTIVLGDEHKVMGAVLDEQGRSVLNRRIEWTSASAFLPGQFDARAQRTGASPVIARFESFEGATTFESAAGDSVTLVATNAGAADVSMRSTINYAPSEAMTRRLVVAVAGVRVTSAKDTTLTQEGEQMTVEATALGRGAFAITSAATVAGRANYNGLIPVSNQGLQWSRIGDGGAVDISGNGDALVLTAMQDGTDTLVVTHSICASGMQCSDTVVVHVAIPAGPVAPPPGGDLIVFNDVNMWQAGIGSSVANQKFFENLVTFSSDSARGAGKTVLFYTGSSSRCATSCAAPNGGYVGALVPKLVELGYTLVNETSSLASIPADVKVVFIWTPTVQLPVDYVNSLKLFAQQGGRVVVVGENGGYMGPEGLAAENQLLADLGAQLTNQGGCDVGGETPAMVAGTHELLAGVPNLDMACASPMTPGPNDYVLFRDADNNNVVGAVVTIDTTPIPYTVRRR